MNKITDHIPKKSYILIFLIIPIILLFWEVAKAGAKLQTDTSECYLRSNEISGQYVYILIDESLSMNLADPNGEFRYSVTGRIIDFLVSYGWLANDPPLIEVFQYSSEWKENINPIWPDTDNVLMHPSQVVLHKALRNITPGNSIAIETLYEKIEKIKYPRNSSGRSENLIMTFDFLKREIENDNS